MADYQIFEAGNVVLQSGLTYRNARLAYKTHGTLNADKSNVIVYPTSYGAQHTDLEWQIGPGRPLDPTKYFIVIINKFGNGLSSSPSNTPPPFDRGRYPHFTMTDNVRVQQRLLAEVFGVERVKLVYGFSMGGMQAFHWAALFPDRVERIAPICGSAKTLAAQFRVSRRRQGGADRRPGLAGRLVRHPADPRLPGDGPGLCRLGPQPGLLPRGVVAPDRLFLARGFPDRQLGGEFPPPRRQRSAGDAVDVAACRHQRQRALRRRPRQGARGDHRRRDRHAVRDRSLFHGRGQPARGRPHAARRIAADPVDLGPPRRQSGVQAGRRRIHQRRGRANCWRGK